MNFNIKIYWTFEGHGLLFCDNRYTHRQRRDQKLVCHKTKNDMQKATQNFTVQYIFRTTMVY